MADQNRNLNRPTLNGIMGFRQLTCGGVRAAAAVASAAVRKWTNMNPRNAPAAVRPHLLGRGGSQWSLVNHQDEGVGGIQTVLGLYRKGGSRLLTALRPLRGGKRAKKPRIGRRIATFVVSTKTLHPKVSPMCKFKFRVQSYHYLHARNHTIQPVP